MKTYLINLLLFLFVSISCTTKKNIDELDKTHFSKILRYMKTKKTPYFFFKENATMKVSSTLSYDVIERLRFHCEDIEDGKKSDLMEKLNKYYDGKNNLCDWVKTEEKKFSMTKTKEKYLFRDSIVKPEYSQLSDKGRCDNLILFYRITNKIVGISIVKNGRELEDEPEKIGPQGGWGGHAIVTLFFVFPDVNAEPILVDYKNVAGVIF